MSPGWTCLELSYTQYGHRPRRAREVRVNTTLHYVRTDCMLTGMRVTVDFDACAAHGDCVAAAPDIFDLGDDDDVVRILMPEPPEELRASALTAADACP